MKFKKGDKVKLINPHNDLWNDLIGTIYIVESYNNGLYFTRVDSDPDRCDRWAWFEDELTLVKPKFNHEGYVFGKVAMHCPTKEACDIFLQYMKEHGKDRYYKSAWEQEKELTCYNLNMHNHCNVVWYIEHGYRILEFDDFDWSDFEIKKFTKADLKNGDVVKFRNGKVGIVVADQKYILAGSEWIDFGSLRDDLLYVHPCDTPYDIMAVRRINTVYGNPLNTFIHGYGELIFERKEVEEMTLSEVCKALGKEIKIVKEK